MSTSRRWRAGGRGASSATAARCACRRSGSWSQRGAARGVRGASWPVARRGCGSAAASTPSAQVGPLINARQRDRVEAPGRRRARAAARRAGRRQRAAGPRRAASSSSRRCSPVSRRRCRCSPRRSSARCCAVTTFDELDEAIALANRTPLRPGRVRVDERPCRGDARPRTARVRHDRRQRVGAAGDRGAVRAAGRTAASATRAAARASRTISRPS